MTTGLQAQAEDVSLYVSARKIYPQAVSGRFRSIKWALLILTLGIYYALPFVRWDRGPDAPGQAVLIDLAHQRAYFFFIEIWPQEVYYLTGLLVLAAMTLFLMNAVAGRLWCGYLCPQTVWCDLFLAVERRIEGDRRARMALDAAPWTAEKIAKKAAKHAAWLFIAWWTGGAWVLYFADAPTLVRDLAVGAAPISAYVWIGILTFTTYTLAGHMREQVCLYMCPWPRIQAALTDRHALNVAYRRDRGEPRMSLKHATAARNLGSPAGDCVDCVQCVTACPTGVDIREGSQLGCIQCGLCIDACDTVMGKIGRPQGLIGYDTEVNIGRRAKGLAPTFKIVRSRTVFYAVVIALVSGVMSYALATRAFTGLDVIHDRNPLFVRLSDGGVRNGYVVRILNKETVTRTFSLSVAGLARATIEAVGAEIGADGLPAIQVGPDTTRELRVVVTAPAPGPDVAATPIQFRVTESASGDVAGAGDFFRSPVGKYQGG
ncbi:cytochrome c oxidase accessory protein CcoG [Hansschlegelia zhihuaiae]|uniref:Cytochrome c oxidase accessory protein CcoG n=1 Tax=Hansschlegelia zhihuaiae TaxID=405005 RepID=A0A4Q0MI10_9HYPH|nr:cytochrome c oxidase accessory protein CcoG [Hansschlegelia zhihuaiae]RXF73168.1 cytochrome c oxidase accessory protein CcoG [Hansschlegelia zhihuaiae]